LLVLFCFFRFVQSSSPARESLAATRLPLEAATAQQNTYIFVLFSVHARAVLPPALSHRCDYFCFLFFSTLKATVSTRQPFRAFPLATTKRQHLRGAPGGGGTVSLEIRRDSRDVYQGIPGTGDIDSEDPRETSITVRNCRVLLARVIRRKFRDIGNEPRASAMPRDSLSRLTFIKGCTSGRDMNRNFSQHCQRHALMTR